MSTTTTVPPAPSPTVDRTNFANNAFSDFAPLFVLFGDDTTKQFLATSMGWADDILLGIAPIGIITIVLSAIRIGGHRYLRSLIGRARDSVVDDEKEILSSTSDNVREIWDGKRVVRQTGESQMKTLVYDPAWNIDVISDDSRFDPPFILLDEAADPDRIYAMDYRYAPTKLHLYVRKMRKLMRLPTDRKKRDWNEELRERATKSPSLTLNMKGVIPDMTMVLSLTAFGIMIQAGVLVFKAIVVYYLHWLRAGSVIASYGYPVWAVGTISISLGVSLCARVVEDSTAKYTLKRGPWARRADQNLRIIRVQPKIPHADFPAYAIRQSGDKPPIHVSIRDFNDNQASVRTSAGAILTIAGFILQNIGTRELHWSAGIAQLCATVVLAMFRGFLRHHIGDPLTPEPLELEEHFESCELAVNLENSVCYILSSRIHPNWNKEGPDWFPIPRLSKTQLLTGESTESVKLGRLLVLQSELVAHRNSMSDQIETLLPERGDVLSTSSCLCQAIENSLNHFMKDLDVFSWTQYMSLSEKYTWESLRRIQVVGRENSRESVGKNGSTIADDFQNVLGFQLTAQNNSLGGDETRSTRRRIQSMISLTWYFYASAEQEIFDFRSRTYWVLAFGTKDDLEEQKKILGNLLPNLAIWRCDLNGSLYTRSSEEHNQLEELGKKYAWMDPSLACFGLRHSSLFSDSIELSNYELVYERGPENENCLLQFLATDLFSNFLFELFAQNPLNFQIYFKDGIWNKDVEQVIQASMVLFYPECTQEDVKVAVIPALLALGIKFPIVADEVGVIKMEE